MELFYDDLLFDNRNRDDLFAGFPSRQPLYADIIKRWTMGNIVSESELSIVTSILIFYPEYVLKNGQEKEFIELIQYSLQQPDLNNKSGQEKGLLLYNLFFLLLKLGKKEESLKTLDALEKFFNASPKTNNLSKNTQQSISDNDYINNSKISGYSISPTSLENAYIEIITCVMNESGILSLKPGFNISYLPVPHDMFSNQEGYNLRSQALSYYCNKELDKASAIYRRMLFNKFELPGTLTHLVRLELSRGNITQAEIFIVNAWRIRHRAPMYVLARIVFFVIFLNMLRSEKFEKWLGCMKYVVNQQGSKMYWEIGSQIMQYEKDVIPQNICLLRGILEVISGGTDEVQLNKFQIWQNTYALALEEWPDYDIVF